MLPLRDAYFDTSDYPPDHFLYSRVNCKVLGKFKDEYCKPLLEFVGLRSKMYSILIDRSDNEEISKRTAKGIKRCYISKRVRHDMYLETLQSRKPTYASFRNFRSKCHQLQTVNFEKICLFSYDDKRYVLSNGVETMAYFRYRISSLC